MTTASALYVGPVTHRRMKPKAHALRYRVFMLLLDLDEAPRLLSKLRLLRDGAFGLMSFRAKDHGDTTTADLKTYVRNQLTAAGVIADGPIRLLCMPRILGYGFNPISVYFCHAADGSLAALLYEVRNTFGQRHSYLVATPDGDAPHVRQTAPKRFYVSPFMDMDMTYVFDVSPPDDAVAVTVRVDDAAGPVLIASFSGERRPLTDGQLFQVWLTHPLLTLKVMFGIHWEAIKIVLKGFRFHTRPPHPPEPNNLGRKFTAQPGVTHV